MELTALFRAEIEREAAPTRRVLGRVPEGKADWKPHAKSMPMGYLAQLVATVPGWIALMIENHRGQLTVYLRLNDALVPSVYGPTADEKGF